MATQAQPALRVSIEHLLEGVQVLGFDWKYLYVNETAARQGQRRADQLVGRTIMECYPGVEQTGMFAAITRVMQARQSERIPNEFVFPNGQRGWFELFIQPVPDGVCILSLDVTDRERMHAQLREAESRTRFALGAARMGVWELRVHTNEMVGSESLQPILGFETGGEPRTLEDFLAYVASQDRSTLRDALKKARLTPDDPFTAVFQIVRPKGERRWIEGHGRFVLDRNDHPDVLLGVAIDVTERLTAELQLKQAQKMEAVGQLAGGIAHDFNNVLTAILGYSELILDRVRDDPELTADMEEITKAGERAARLTRQLLAFSRTQLMVPQVLDLHQLVVELEKMLSRVIGHHIRVEIATVDGLSHTKADPGTIEQVLMNLAVNARDAMPEGGTVRITTANAEIDTEFARRHDGAKVGRYVVLTVADTGTGMAPEVLAHVFEPFFTTKSPGRGTGLGLATVYGIVKQSGGYITIDSTPGAGTSVAIYLPAVDELVARKPSASARASVRGTETILLVEDDACLRDLTRKMLEPYGYTVLEATDVADAVAIAEHHPGPIDMLLTDILMPILNGPVLAQRIVSVRHELRVLYVSGFPQTFAEHSGAVGARASFLAKPFTSVTLATKVRECLDRP